MPDPLLIDHGRQQVAAWSCARAVAGTGFGKTPTPYPSIRNRHIGQARPGPMATRSAAGTGRAHADTAPSRRAPLASQSERGGEHDESSAGARRHRAVRRCDGSPCQPSLASTSWPAVLAVGPYRVPRQWPLPVLKPLYDVAMGDSLAAGTGASSTSTRYVNVLYQHELSRFPTLQLENIACGGATTNSVIHGPGCSYTTGTQLGDAEAFLRAHPRARARS